MQRKRKWVLLADLERSRSVSDRARLAEALEATLTVLRKKYIDEWQAPLVSIKGLDELGAVLRRPRHVFDLIIAIQEAVWPEQFRWALAWDIVDISPDAIDVTDMDGPAFHRAAAILAEARRENRILRIQLPEDAPQLEAVPLVEAAADLHNITLEGWTEARLKIVRTAREHATQAAAAASLGLSDPTVSVALQKAKYTELRRLEEAMRGWLDSLGSSR